MGGYINGKIEIFCGDSPPHNLNVLWEKRIIEDGVAKIILYEFNTETSQWQIHNTEVLNTKENIGVAQYLIEDLNLGTASRNNTEDFDLAGTAQELIDGLDLGTASKSDISDFQPSLTDDQNFVSDIQLVNINKIQSIQNDLLEEVSNRENADSLLQNQLSSAISGYIGSIPHNEVLAPEPNLSGYYEFNSSGIPYEWVISAGAIDSVSSGDRIYVNLIDSTYTYFYVSQSDKVSTLPQNLNIVKKLQVQDNIGIISNVQFGTFINSVSVSVVEGSAVINISSSSPYGRVCYAYHNRVTQATTLDEQYIVNGFDKLVWNIKSNNVYIVPDAVQVEDYELILFQPVLSNENILEVGLLSDKYKYNPGYYEFFKLQDENSLIIDFQSRNATNSNQRFLSFKFNGEFTIQSGITGIKNSFSWEDFLETFADLIDNGLIAIPYGRKISYNFTSGELNLGYSYLDVARDELILLDNWLPYPEELGISNNNIRGYFADIYYKKLITLDDYLEGLKRPDFYWHKELEDKLNLISSELSPTDFIFTVTTDMHVSVANRNNYHLLNWGIVNYIHEKINPKFHIDLGDSIYQSSPLLNKTLGLTNIRTAASLFNCKNKMFVIGNHDYNSMPGLNPNESFYFSDKEIFNSIGRNINTDVVWGSKEKIYYYKDFIEEKIRVIVLNTTQNTPSFDVSGEMTSLDPMNYPVIQQNQVDWFANIALDFSDKTDKTEWHTIIFSHISPSPINNDTPRCENAKDDNNVIYDLINAFKNAGTVNYNHVDLVQDGMATVSITKSFISQGEMNLIGCISGHTHYAANYDYNGIIFRTLLAGHNYEETQIPYTTNATSVPFVSINKENRTLKIRYFGYGESLSLFY